MRRQRWLCLELTQSWRRSQFKFWPEKQSVQSIVHRRRKLFFSKPLLGRLLLLLLGLGSSK